jgi:hypothetical protein
MHTPAPWHLSRLGQSHAVCRRDGKAVALVVPMPTTAQHALDDAHLIHAAPEMFAALQTLVSTLGDCALTQPARAAIAKATGEKR